MTASEWPTVNACLNAASFCLVVAGLLCVKRKWVVAHRALMVSALVVSAAFLASYLAYHAQVGSVRYTRQGWIRAGYFALLVSHTILAVAIVPLVLRTAWLAIRNRIEGHRAIARWTAPLWLYVSASGVAVYWMLYRWVIIGALLAAILLPVNASACPGCKEAAFDTAEQSRAKLASAKGYGLSIGLMLLVPVSLIGGIGITIARGAKRGSVSS
jgi:uncharacterized membrane protein YozB (DUF420 family)